VKLFSEMDPKAKPFVPKTGRYRSSRRPFLQKNLSLLKTPEDKGIPKQGSLLKTPQEKEIAKDVVIFRKQLPVIAEEKKEEQVLLKPISEKKPSFNNLDLRAYYRAENKKRVETTVAELAEKLNITDMISIILLKRIVSECFDADIWLPLLYQNVVMPVYIGKNNPPPNNWLLLFFRWNNNNFETMMNLLKEQEL
jgi:hypothetical protein